MAVSLRRNELQPVEWWESLANSFDERLEGSTLTFKVKRHKFVGEAKNLVEKLFSLNLSTNRRCSQIASTA